MSQFSGPQSPGAMARRRELKREQAETRQESVEHDRTRRHRRDKCNPGEHLLQEIFVDPHPDDVDPPEAYV